MITSAQPVPSLPETSVYITIRRYRSGANKEVRACVEW